MYIATVESSKCENKGSHRIVCGELSAPPQTEKGTLYCNIKFYGHHKANTIV